MDFNKMFFGGALIGTLVTCWNTIKSVSWKICTLVLKKVVLDDALSVDVMNYLRENHRYYYLHDRSYLSTMHYTKTNKRYEYTAWEYFENCSVVFFSGYIPFYFTQFSKNEDNKDQPSSTKRTTYIYYLRGSLDIADIIKRAISRINNISQSHQTSTHEASRFYLKYVPGNVKEEKYDVIYNFNTSTRSPLSHKLSDLGYNNNLKSFDNLVLTPENREVLQLTYLWKNNKQWYTEREIKIPWKLGLLLTGPGGTGKTTMARSIAEYLNIPIYVYRLSMLSDIEFIEEWAKMQSAIPCMALIEDFDNVFHGRTNVSSGDSIFDLSVLTDKNNQDSGDKNISKPRGRRLTFDTFLNALDGVERYEGILTIITTNDIEKVDKSALLDRPGRIDKVVELTYLTEENKDIMIDKICHDMPIARQKALDYIKVAERQLTPAQLQEKCIEYCLQEFYNNSLKGESNA